MIWPLIAIAIGAFALSYAAAKKAQKEARKAADAFKGVLVNKESNVEPIPVVYGERRVGGTRVYVQAEGGEKNKYLYIALVLCEGEVEDIDDIRIDDFPLTGGRYGNLRFRDFGNVKVWDGGPDDQFADLVYIESHHGKPFQEASGILESSSKWTSSHRLQGVAYLAIRLRWNEDIFSGMPEITAVVKGRKVYDPRTGATAWSENPALCLLDYMKNDTFGKGLPNSALDLTAFGDAATYCEQTVVEAAVVPEQTDPLFIRNFNIYGDLWLDEVAAATGPSTTQEQLFRCNMVLDTGERIFQNVNTMLLGMRGFLPYINGKYSLNIDRSIDFDYTNDLTLSPDDIIGGIQISDVTKNERFNRVICKFPNPRAEWQPDEAIWPEPDSPESQLFLQQDGELLVDEVDLETITSYYAARDFARIFVQRSRNALRCNIKATSKALNAVAGDVINVVHPTPGWTSGKLFQVETIALDYDGTCDLQLVEYDPSVYSYEPDNLQPPIPDTDLPSPFDVDAPDVLTLERFYVFDSSGKRVANIKAAWTPSESSYVTRYELAWTATTALSFAEGSGATSVLTPLNEYTVEDLLTQVVVAEKGESGAENTFINILNTVQGVRGVLPYSSTIKQTAVPYLFGVRAITAIGAKSRWTYASLGGVEDTTPPSPPTSANATGQYKSNIVTWVNATDPDLRHVEVWASRTNNVGAGGLVSQSAFPTTNFLHAGLGNAEGYYYFLRSVDNVGNVSGYVSAGYAETQFIDVPDFTKEVTDIFDEAGLYGIPPYNSLQDAPAGEFIGQLIFDRQTGKLYEWDGDSWVAVVPDINDLVGEIPDTVTIGDDFITSPMIAADAVIGRNILGETITGDKIFANTITGGLLATSGIITSAAQIENAVIEAAAIKDLAVTTAKISDLTVSTLKIADGAVTIPTGTSRNPNVNLGTAFTDLASVSVSWKGGAKNRPRALIVNGNIGVLGSTLNGSESPASTVGINFKVTYGGGNVTGAGGAGQSFAQGFGGSVAATGFLSVASGAQSPITVTVQGRNVTGTRGCTAVGVSVIGAKK